MVLSEPATRVRTRAAARSEDPAAAQITVTYGRRYLTAAEPWTPRSIRLVVLVGALATVAAGLCWYAASDERVVEDQAPWLLGSLLATAVFALAGTVWLIAAFRTLRQGMRDLAADKRAFALSGRSLHQPPEHLVSGTGLVVGTGMIRAHRSGCLLVEGKPVRAVGPDESGLETCGVCQP